MAKDDVGKLMEHQGYLGSVNRCQEGDAFHGRLEFIRDLVTYEGEDARQLTLAFQESIDDYLQFCRALGRSPDTPGRASCPQNAAT